MGPGTDQPVDGKVGDQSVMIRNQERGSQMVDDDEEDWLGSQLDQESFNDQTLTYCILNELEDMQRLVTSPRVKQRNEDDNAGRKDNILDKEDDVVVDGRRPSVVGDQMLLRVGDTSTVEAGKAGYRRTILKQDGGVGTGYIPTNQSSSLDDDPSDGVPNLGTTVVYNSVGQPHSVCQD